MKNTHHNKKYPGEWYENGEINPERILQWHNRIVNEQVNKFRDKKRFSPDWCWTDLYAKKHFCMCSKCGNKYEYKTIDQDECTHGWLLENCAICRNNPTQIEELEFERVVKTNELHEATVNKINEIIRYLNSLKEE